MRYSSTVLNNVSLVYWTLHAKFHKNPSIIEE